MKINFLVDSNDTENTGLVPMTEENDSSTETLPNDGDVIGVLPLRNMVLFPGVLTPITISRPRSKKLVEMTFEQEKMLVVCCQKDADVVDPKGEDLYPLGTCARVARTIDVPDGSTMVILEGISRVQVVEFLGTKPFLKARIKHLPEIFPKKNDKHFLAITGTIQDLTKKIIKRSENIPPEMAMLLSNITNIPSFINYVCANFGLRIVDKQELLSIDKLEDRALRLIEFLNKEVQIVEMKADIIEKTHEDLTKQQREFYLHQQIETIQKELGDGSEQQTSEMTDRAKSKKWPEEVKGVFEKELKRLQHIPTYSPEYSIQETYLNTLLELPWNEYSDDTFDVLNAKKLLDENHYGMKKVKERIIEYIAVQRQLHVIERPVEKIKSPIICLYGPPGVGKTSLGKSIATALGRKYVRISLGGVHDESEIRGHRKTYIGAMPGQIIEGLVKAKTSNPVFVLDEVDKIGVDYHGDPTAALLEVLDPEQNAHFHDNFLNLDYDLSKVFFIATANSLDTIPQPLLDRMELIEMTGYSIEEKREIAKRHLIPDELEKNGLTSKQLKFKKDIVEQIIDDYTRESGVRNLDRKIATICRKVVTKIASKEEYNITITPEDVVTYLGVKRYTRDEYENNKYIGVVTGLAWTQVGGEILFIEASLSRAKTPTLTLTGNLGDVMKESATLALGYIKAHASELKIPSELFDKNSVHIHVPEGAVPKDGPSAGITMTVALVSAFTKRKVRPRIAMTGEMTLRGKVLPIGGVKEKLLAAKRGGITDLILCSENERDVNDIEPEYLKGLKFHYVKDINEVLKLALL